MKRNLANYVRLQLFSFKKFAYSPMPTNVFLIFFFFWPPIWSPNIPLLGNSDKKLTLRPCNPHSSRIDSVSLRFPKEIWTKHSILPNAVSSKSSMMHWATRLPTGDTPPKQLHLLPGILSRWSPPKGWGRFVYEPHGLNIVTIWLIALARNTNFKERD